jgi:hypothetical protein
MKVRKLSFRRKIKLAKPSYKKKKRIFSQGRLWSKKK